MSGIIHDADKLLEKGIECMNKAQPQLAARFFAKALEQRSQDTAIMDTLAECYLSMGDAHNAVPLLEKSIELDPEGAPYKYLNMAQLEEGPEALACYQAAIRIFERMRENREKVQPSTIFASKEIITEGSMDVDDSGEKAKSADTAGAELAKAYCGIAELYLTDLCDEEGAEENCEAALKSALFNEKNNLDARQTFASMRISQCRSEEACTMIQDVYDEVYPLYKENQNKPLVSMGADAKEGNIERGGDVPDGGFLLQTCKLMIDCAADKASLASQALDLLELLLNENDEDPELWYVMGMGYLSCDPKDKHGAKDAFTKGRAFIEKSVERADEAENQGDNDDAQQMGAEEWHSYLELFDQQLSALEIDEDDQWEDAEEEEDEEG